MSETKKLLLLWLILINVIAFALYGADKLKAKRNSWRIPESSLITVAAVGGGLGAFLGMKLFHHKTRHAKFTVLVPMLMILWAGLAVWYFFLAA